MKYVIYLRVSTDKQDVRTQLDECLHFIKSYHKRDDFTYEVFQDSISSRKNILKRQGIQAAFKAIKKSDCLISVRVDRLSRSYHEINDIVRYLDEKNADCAFVYQPGIKDKIMLGIYAGMAEKERETLSIRTKSKLKAKRERGERYGRHVPYGYAMHPTELVKVKNRHDGGWTMKLGLLVECPQEQLVLSHIVDLFDQGITYREISKRLAELGHYNRQGKPFEPGNLLRILTRIGKTRWYNQPLDQRELELSREVV